MSEISKNYANVLMADEYYHWYEDEQDAVISAVLLLDDVLEMFVGRIEGMAEGVGGPNGAFSLWHGDRSEVVPIPEDHECDGDCDHVFDRDERKILIGAHEFLKMVVDGRDGLAERLEEKRSA